MDLRRLAAAALTIIFALAISAESAFAAEKDEVVAAVHQYLATMDKPETMCDSHVSILDEFPPHECIPARPTSEQCGSPRMV